MKNPAAGFRGSADAWFRLLTAAAVFLGLVQGMTIGLSLMRVVFSRLVSLAVLGLSAAGATVFHRRMRGLPEADDLAADPAPGPARLLARLAPLLLALLLVVLANSYLHPYLAADSAIYHLPAIHYWGERGYVHWVDLQPYEVYYTDLFVNGYPKAAELMGFVAVRATHLDGLASLINVWFLLIGVSGVSYMARRLGASPAGALVAGLLYAMAPVNLQQMNGSYVDSAFAAAVVGLLAMLFRIAEPARGHPLPWSVAVGFGACAGLVLGIKGAGPLPVGLAGLAALFLLVWRGRELRRGRGLAQGMRAVAWLALAALVMSLVGGYWYVRNAVHTGNPFYPVALKLGRVVDLPGLPRSYIMNEAANLPAATAGWPDWKRVAFAWMQGGPAHWPYSVCSVSGRLGGLGLVWLLGCLPALLLSWRACRRRGRPLLAVCLVAAVLFLLTPMHWWARYTLWLLGIGLPCLVAVLEQLRPGKPRRAGMVWTGLLLSLFLVELVFGIGWVAGADPVDWYGGLGPFPPRSQILFSRLTWRQPFTAVNQPNQGRIYQNLMSSRLPVAVGPLYPNDTLSAWAMAMFGTVCDPLGRRPVRLFKPADPPDDGRLRDFLRDRQIAFVVWEAALPHPLLLDALSSDVEIAGQFCYFKISRRAFSRKLPR